MLNKSAKKILSQIDSSYFHLNDFHGNFVDRQRQIIKLINLLEQNDIRAKIGNTAQDENKVLLIHRKYYKKAIDFMKSIDFDIYRTLKKFYNDFKKKYNLM